MLDDLGQIVSASNGADGVQFASKSPPDIILLDFQMPEMDGYEVLAALQSIVPPEAFLPVLVLTEDAITAREKALSLGAAGPRYSRSWSNTATC